MASAGALGFKISLLEKAADIKSFDPRVSLMHYIVLLVNQRDPSIKLWVEELSSLQQAARVCTELW